MNSLQKVDATTKIQSLLSQLTVSPVPQNAVSSTSNGGGQDGAGAGISQNSNKKQEIIIKRLKELCDSQGNGPLDQIVNGNVHTDNIDYVSNPITSTPLPNTIQNGGGGMAQFLQQYQSGRDADIAKRHAEQEQLRLASLPPKEFNRNRVPKQILDHMQSLPIYQIKDHLIKTIKENQMVVIIGETGSGKSTQIPQYLVDAGFAKTGKIGITQPRRVAARSLAERVAVECGVKIGSLVGYAVRFDKCYSGDTLIKYMTDGLLVKEFALEPNLDTYSVIVIDEAHERSIHTDICFGLLKRAAKLRPDLRIVISSATLEEDKFSMYFNKAPIISVVGRGFPVDIIHEPRQRYDSDFIQSTVDTIFKIHKTEPKGDILVFLTGQDDIDAVWELIDNKMAVTRVNRDELLILPCFGGLPFDEQQRIFEPTPNGSRKVVLATNLAETSLTIDGVVYVIDCGYFKQNEYNPKTGIDTLVKKKITRFQATQRAGRAGRTSPGKCFRLYTSYEFSMLHKAPTPEIKRCNVDSVLLDLISLGVTNVLEFDFMDRPPGEALMEALEHLQELSALGKDLSLTSLGRRMSEFPLDPPLAKVVIESSNLGCSIEILKIVALLSTQSHNIFYSPKKQRVLSDSKKALFNQPEGDHLTLLKIYKEWELNQRSNDWCKQNFLQFRYLEEAEEIRIQLRDILLRHNLEERSCGRMTEKIQKAFTAGYFRKIAKKRLMGHSYQTLTVNSLLKQEDVFMHPSSCLFQRKPSPSWVLYHEVKRTSKAYMRCVMTIQPEWVKEYSPNFANRVVNTYGILF